MKYFTTFTQLCRSDNKNFYKFPVMKRLLPLIDGVFYFMEIWIDVKGYEGSYMVSDMGRIKSVKFGKEKILKQVKTSKGYHSVILWLNGEIKHYKTHQIVAFSFLNHIPCGNKLVIDHINNIKTDNRLCNLQILTGRENTTKDSVGISIYTGVSWNKGVNKWRAAIGVGGKTIHLGYFNCEIEASEAYQARLKLLK